MNLLFQTRKPRRFHHEMIYVDERKERLSRLEEHARQEVEADKEHLSNEAFRRRIHEAVRPSSCRRRLPVFSSQALMALLIILFTAILLLIL